jgi:hypothetical protein
MTTLTLTYADLKSLVLTHGTRKGGYLTIDLPSLVKRLGSGCEAGIVAALRSDENLTADRRLKPWPADSESAGTRRAVKLAGTWYTAIALV